MRRLRPTIAALALALVYACHASAAITITYDQPSYSVLPGGTVNVQMFLTETAPDTLLSTEGLLSAGITMTFSAPSGSNAFIASINDIIINPAFDFVVSRAVNGTTGASFQIAVLNNPPPTGSSILLGTLVFQAGSPGSVTTVTPADINPTPNVDNTVTGGPTFTVLDSRIVYAPIEITTVPEPSSVVLCGLGVCGVAATLWRRRKVVKA